MFIPHRLGSLNVNLLVVADPVWATAKHVQLLSAEAGKNQTAECGCKQITGTKPQSCWDCTAQSKRCCPSRRQLIPSDASRAVPAAQRALALPPASWHLCAPALSALAHLCRRGVPAWGEPAPPSSNVHSPCPPGCCCAQDIAWQLRSKASPGLRVWSCRPLCRLCPSRRQQGLCCSTRLRQPALRAGGARPWLWRAARYQNL